MAVLMALALTALGACQAKQATVVAPEGMLEVLGPFPGFSPLELPGDWVVEGGDGTEAGQLRVVERDGVPALRVENGENDLLVVRRTRAMLLATPFLSWSWYIEPPAATGFHPTRLIVGFRHLKGDGRDWRSDPSTLLGSSIPEHEKAIALTWGSSALQRGTLSSGAPGEDRQAPRYTVRGGRENAGSWWLETTDIANLFARAWPEEDAADVQVVFIGIAAAGGRAPAAALVSGIVLSR